MTDEKTSWVQRMFAWGVGVTKLIETPRHYLSIFTLVSFTLFWWNTGSEAQAVVLYPLAGIVAINSLCICAIGIADRKYKRD